MTQAYAIPLDPGLLVALHGRVEQQFEAYEAAEGSLQRRRQAVAAMATTWPPTSPSRTSCCTRPCGLHSGRYDLEIERQLQQDHLFDLAMVEFLGGMLPADRGYDGKVRVLMQVFRQHAHDAEALLLPELRRRLGAGRAGAARPGWSGSGSASWRAARGGLVTAVRRLPAPLVPLAVAAVVLAGCGGDEGGPGPRPPR